MNKQNTIQLFNEKESLQNRIINDIRKRISDAETDAEATSKEKFIAKQQLIESANDMSTQEKLDAMDKNYDRRNQERWQNTLWFGVMSFGVVGLAISSSYMAKNFRGLLATA